MAPVCGMPLATVHSHPILSLPAALLALLDVPGPLPLPLRADTVESLRSLLREGAMEDREITVEVPVKEPGQGGKDGAAGPKGMGMGGLGDLDVSIAGESPSALLADTDVVHSST